MSLRRWLILIEAEVLVVSDLTMSRKDCPYCAEDDEALT